MQPNLHEFITIFSPTLQHIPAHCCPESYIEPAARHTAMRCRPEKQTEREDERKQWTEWKRWGGEENEQLEMHTAREEEEAAGGRQKGGGGGTVKNWGKPINGESQRDQRGWR